MRTVTIQKIEEEINEKRKMPKDVKEALRKEIFINIIICAFLVTYFLFLFLGSVDKTKEVRAIDLKIFSTIYLATSIILFEIAYRKDSGKLAIHGIEILLVAIMTLFLPYIIFELDSKYQKIYYFIGEYIAAYYVIKCICIAVIRKRKYNKDISDIKEIVKKEKRPIKKENEEIIKEPKVTVENKKEEETVEEKTIEKTKRETNTKKKTTNKESQKKEIKKSEIKKNKKVVTKNVANKEIKESNKKTKTSTKPKATKTETLEKKPKTTTKKKAIKEVKEKKEEAPKKRGRPKKQETIEKEIKKEIKVEPAVKKRGRPRKVVNQ